MPRVRVFVPTFRRARLLRRALQSLLAQTCDDWVAEVHNDDPSDREPIDILNEVADARIRLVQHDQNLGATATFNLFFRRCEEPFMSILEDDNWWQPEFIREMLDEMDKCPEATIAWSNMRVWSEQGDGTWADTGAYTWPVVEGEHAARRIPWGNPKQAFGALHSNGSMIARTHKAADWRTPLVEFSAMEAIRERTYPHPMLFVPRPLANYSQTLTSHRKQDRRSWGTYQTLLVATFAATWSTTPDRVRELWAFARTLSAGATSALLLASFQDGDLGRLRVPASPGEWLRFVASSIRHPLDARYALHARRRQVDLWDFLIENSSRRSSEARQQLRQYP